MNIDSLTYKELKEIAAIFQATNAVPVVAHPFVGKYVICRCYSAGVHAGELISQNGDQVVLKNSRRLWNWIANGGVALSGLAVNGLKSGKIDTVLPELFLTGVIETIPCSEAAEASINDYK
jgi:hypothetical protein